MEGRAHRAAGQQDVDMPHLRHVEPEKHGQDKRAERDEAVGQDHRAFAIPSVDIDPDERAQQRLGQHTRDRGQCQYLGRTGLDAHPEDDRIADDRAAEDRGELPAPDNPECLFPVFHACCAVVPKKADTEVSAAANPSVKGLFNCFNYCLECFWLVHCQVGQNLAVQCDALGVEFADKL